MVNADTFAFIAAAPLVPAATETVTVPAGPGVTGANGKKLSQPSTAHFTVAQGSTLRLQQLLAELGYLPVSFTPARPLTAPQEAAQAQEGSFSWRWNEPTSLESLWTVGTANQITKGAVMAFESQYNLKADGIGRADGLAAAAVCGIVRNRDHCSLQLRVRVRGVCPRRPPSTATVPRSTRRGPTPASPPRPPRRGPSPSTPATRSPP